MTKPVKILNIPASALVVLIGVAGSGKSTFATGAFRATEILSSDSFRGMVSDDEGNQDASDDAFALLHLILEKRLRRGKLCVVDATNVRPDYRARLLDAARTFGRPAVAIVFDTPEKICVARSASRAARVVSAQVIRVQSKALETQTDEDLLGEGFRKVYRIKPEDSVEVRRPFTVWFTGLSGSGKSTLARGLSGHLAALSIEHEVLDGDELRRTVCRDLGFSREDRDENIRRIAQVAADLNKKDVTAIVAAISPYRDARQSARRQCERFVEVFVDCSLETLQRRDPKGLYRRALAGEIQNFSGVSDPYEKPEQAEIYINSDTQTEQESLKHLVSELVALGYLPHQD